MSASTLHDFLPKSPYPGIEPYTYVERNLLYGREAEARKLMRLVTMFRGVLLYSASGIGKSSLVNAQLIPLALMEGFQPERIRVQLHYGQEVIVERISQCMHDMPPFLPSLFADDEPQARVVLPVEVFLDKLHQEAESKRPLLIFDQFEEWFTAVGEDTADNGPEEARASQARLCETIVSLFNESQLPVKLLIVLREDYLANIAPILERCPRLSDQYLRLGALEEEQIYTVIRAPLEQHAEKYRPAISCDLASTIQRQFKERSHVVDIQLTEVQIVCETLYETGKQGSDLERYFEDAGGVPGILEQYLDDALASCPTNAATAIALLARMVTPAGTRNVISLDDLLSRVAQESHISPEMLSDTLNFLEYKAKLIRHERRREADFYEIRSEFLVEGVLKRAREQQRSALSKQLAQAQEEARHQRKTARVLTAVAAFLFGLLGLGLLFWWVPRLNAERELENAKTDCTPQCNCDTLYLAALDRYLELNPTSTQRLVERSSILDCLGRHDEAILDLTKAIELDPENADAYLERGKLKAAQANYEGAIADFDAAIRRYGESIPESADAYLQRGAAKFALSKYEASINDFNKTTELDANNAAAYLQRGVAELALAQYPPAIKDFGKAAALDPSNVTAYLQRGVAELALAQYPPAINDFGKAIELDPSNVTPYLQRGVAELALAQYSPAINDFGKAIELDSNNAAAFLQRGVAEAAWKKYDLALDDLAQSVTLSSKSSTVISQAVELYTQLISLDTDSNLNYLRPKALVLRGRAYIAMSDYLQGMSDTAAGIELDQRLGFWSPSLLRQAIVNYTEVVGYNPDGGRAYVSIGAAYFNLAFSYGERRGPYRPPERAIALSPDVTTISLDIVQAALHRKNITLSESEFSSFATYMAQALARNMNLVPVQSIESWFEAPNQVYLRLTLSPSSVIDVSGSLSIHDSHLHVDITEAAWGDFRVSPDLLNALSEQANALLGDARLSVIFDVRIDRGSITFMSGQR
ncbi:MAG: tetratricopeptide repeat protein [Caldilineaceae bacterium]